MHDQAVSCSIPSVGARREQIHDHARYWRILLKLVGAYRADLVGLHADALSTFERLLGSVLVALRIGVAFNRLTIHIGYPHLGNACQGG